MQKRYILAHEIDEKLFHECLGVLTFPSFHDSGCLDDWFPFLRVRVASSQVSRVKSTDTVQILTTLFLFHGWSNYVD